MSFLPQPIANQLIVVGDIDPQDGTPEGLRDELLDELLSRMPLIQLYEDYFAGRHELNFVSAKFREVFGRMLAAVCDNWMPLIIRAKVERMHVQGFRIGTSLSGDKDAWDIWQRNGLDVDFPLALTESAKHGESYFLVWPDDEQPSLARITVEHPGQMIVRRDPADRKRIIAALKYWWDQTGTAYATLYTPSTVYRWQTTGSIWRPRQDVSEGPNPFGVVPVLPIVNDPHMVPVGAPNAAIVRGINWTVSVGLGRSDLADVVSTQDEINKYVCDMLVASEAGAFIQRWATGLEVPKDPETKKPIDPFTAGAQHLWINEVAEGKFGQFAATDLKNFTGAIENRLQSMASRTNVPMHYMLGSSGSFPSGESLKATENGLVVKTKASQKPSGSAAERAIALALAYEGKRRKAAQALTSSEAQWESPESRTQSEYIDSLVKKLAIGVPYQQLWEDAGYSPEQIATFKTMLVEAGKELGLVHPQLTTRTRTLPAAPDEQLPPGEGQPPKPAPGAPPAPPAPPAPAGGQQ